jgi:hypothetical protein
MVKMGNNVPVLVMCLDVELCLVLRVLPEQTEENGIEDGGFAYAVTTTDGYDVIVELKLL